MNFDSIVGQREVKESLSNAIRKETVAHAYLFAGPRGIGKRTVAEAFAGILLCGEGPEDRACGCCVCCQMTKSGSNPDFRVVEAEGNSIKVEDIRNLQNEIMIKPLYAKRKVYLILDADKMTVQAQNCLLKTLEEPPGNVVLVLTTANYNAILETIRSRTLKYSFKKNTREEVVQILHSRVEGDLKNLEFITAYADGIPGTALALAGSEEFAALREKTIGLCFQLASSKLVDIFSFYDFFETNKSRVEGIFDIMVLLYRDLLVSKKSSNGNVLINSDKKDMIKENAENFPVDKLISNIEEVEAARKAVKQNANYQLAIEVMLMKLQEE